MRQSCPVGLALPLARGKPRNLFQIPRFDILHGERPVRLLFRVKGDQEPLILRMPFVVGKNDFPGDDFPEGGAAFVIGVEDGDDFLRIHEIGSFPEKMEQGGKSKNLSFLTGFHGADTQIRTGDLILTKGPKSP